MDNDEINQEVYLLKCGYIAQFIIFALILLIHLMAIFKMFWFSEALYAVFIYLLILIVIILLFPLFPLLFIYLKRLSLEVAQITKTITLVIILITLALGIITCILMWTTIIKSNNFYENCPYHYTSRDIQKYLNQKNGINCDKRMCLYDKKVDSEVLPYYYICSYNSKNEYKNKITEYSRINDNNKKINSKTYITCDYFDQDKYTIKDEIIQTYIKACKNNNLFYLCNRFEKPAEQSINSINNSDNCPDDIYNVLMYVFGILAILIDVLISYVPLSIEYYLYKKLIYIFNLPPVMNNNDIALNNNHTANSSKNDNNRNNEQNNSQVNYVKEPTEIIIVERDSCNDENDNDNIIIARNKRKNSKDFNINDSIAGNKNHLEKSVSKNEDKEDEDEKIIFSNKEKLENKFNEAEKEKNINSITNYNDYNIPITKKSDKNKMAILNIADPQNELNHETSDNLKNDEMVIVNNDLNGNNLLKNSLINITSRGERKIKITDNNRNDLINSNLNKISVMNSQLITNGNIDISIEQSKLFFSKNTALKNSTIISIENKKDKNKYVTISKDAKPNDIKSENEQSINIYINRFKKNNTLIESSDRRSLVLKSKEKDSIEREDEKEE